MALEHRFTVPGEYVSLRQHFGLGIAYGYPLCCILMFCFDRLFGLKGSGTRRGAIYGKGTTVFVPCGVFHRSQGGKI